MKASDLQLLDDLDVRPDEGTIRRNNRRMLLWDADAFGSLRKQLIDSVGLTRARAVLRRFGFGEGFRDAQAARERLQYAGDRDQWRECFALLRGEGKVLASPQRLRFEREAGTFELTVDWHDSYEAVQHRRVFGRCDEPVCWVSTGYVSGFATACFGEEVFIVERECAATGSGSVCRVEGKTRRAWGPAGDRLAADHTERPGPGARPAAGASQRRSMARVIDLVRELEQAVERASVMSAGDTPLPGAGALPGDSDGEVVALADLEKRYILSVLERFDGNRTHTARALGIGSNTLWRKLKAWGVPPARE